MLCSWILISEKIDIETVFYYKYKALSNRSKTISKQVQTEKKTKS